MPPEVQDIINKSQEIMDKINEKKEKFDNEIGKLLSKLDNLENEYAGRSKEFIESKRKELSDEINNKKKLIDEEIKRLTQQAQDWVDKKKEELIKKAADLALKVLTGADSPEVDDSDNK